MFKQFDDKRADLSEGITADSIAELIAANKLPLVIYFDQDVSIDRPSTEVEHRPKCR